MEALPENCHIENGQLTGVTRRHDIFTTATRLPQVQSQEMRTECAGTGCKDLVSMNMWGLTPDFMEVLEKGFAEFLSGLAPEDTKRNICFGVDHLIKNESAEVDVLRQRIHVWCNLSGR